MSSLPCRKLRRWGNGARGRGGDWNSSSVLPPLHPISPSPHPRIVPRLVRLLQRPDEDVGVVADRLVETARPARGAPDAGDRRGRGAGDEAASTVDLEVERA